LRLHNITSYTNSINLFQNSPIHTYGNISLNGNIDLNDFTLHLRGGGTGTIYGVISEGATNGVTKVDSGIWLLSGANTFTGTTTVIAGILTVNGSVNANIDVQEGATLNGNGTLNWHVGEKVKVAGTLDISQLKLNVQVPETSEGEDFIIVDYSPGSLVGSEFASVSGKPKHCRMIYDTTNSLIILRSFEKGTVVMIQ
jgi:autotransporter-associated beta strand protein